VVVGSFWLIVTAAVAAVVLGVVATVLTHSELMDSRRETGHVKATEAKAYAQLTDARSAENTLFARSMGERLAHSQTALAQVEDALVAAQHRAAETARKLRAEQRRADEAETKTVHYAGKLDEAEERAAEAIVRVAELEQERDVLKSELDAWRMGSHAPARGVAQAG